MKAESDRAYYSQHYTNKQLRKQMNEMNENTNYSQLRPVNYEDRRRANMQGIQDPP
eukprot:CAMPEP_0170506106 /NCGR_PEP_ID=MMETSP0208-20121228/53620_1 /TAXON_ID=197538 /ORGANISM="Strombidium inclinatum, Strain S3" /LENGTH=55 /DNA_ID=CAMNT_0010787411 /DNA_START=262 /DNA_END=429 /DNA_ORIENTATION=-